MKHEYIYIYTGCICIYIFIYIYIYKYSYIHIITQKLEQVVLFPIMIIVFWSPLHQNDVQNTKHIGILQLHPILRMKLWAFWIKSFFNQKWLPLGKQLRLGAIIKVQGRLDLFFFLPDKFTLCWTESGVRKNNLWYWSPWFFSTCQTPSFSWQAGKMKTDWTEALVVGIVYMRTGELDVKAQVSFFFMSLGVVGWHFSRTFLKRNRGWYGKDDYELKWPYCKCQTFLTWGNPNQNLSELRLENCSSFSRFNHAELYQRFLGYDAERHSVSSTFQWGIIWTGMEWYLSGFSFNMDANCVALSPSGDFFRFSIGLKNRIFQCLIVRISGVTVPFSHEHKHLNLKMNKLWNGKIYLAFFGAIAGRYQNSNEQKRLLRIPRNLTGGFMTRFFRLCMSCAIDGLKILGRIGTSFFLVQKIRSVFWEWIHRRSIRRERRSNSCNDIWYNTMHMSCIFI